MYYNNVVHWVHLNFVTTTIAEQEDKTPVCWPRLRWSKTHVFVVVSLEKIGVANVMFLYATMSFVLLVFVILCIPETKGRTLEEISKELAKKWVAAYMLTKRH